jgi:hypothetical protein
MKHSQTFARTKDDPTPEADREIVTLEDGTKAIKTDSGVTIPLSADE